MNSILNFIVTKLSSESIGLQVLGNLRIVWSNKTRKSLTVVRYTLRPIRNLPWVFLIVPEEDLGDA